MYHLYYAYTSYTDTYMYTRTIIYMYMYFYQLCIHVHFTTREVVVILYSTHYTLTVSLL